jgi:uncharacterized membrane protein
MNSSVGQQLTQFKIPDEDIKIMVWMKWFHLSIVLIWYLGFMHLTWLYKCYLHHTVLQDEEICRVETTLYEMYYGNYEELSWTWLIYMERYLICGLTDGFVNILMFPLICYKIDTFLKFPIVKKRSHVIYVSKFLPEDNTRLVCQKLGLYYILFPTSSSHLSQS